MKYLILSFLLLMNSNIFSQTQNTIRASTNFNLELLGGINYTNISGPTFIVEGSKQLTQHMNLNFSIGYLVAYKNNFRIVKAYKYVNVPGLQQYQTEDYNINSTKFHIAQFNLGLDYAINDYGKFTPYSFIEAGYNAYSAEFETTPIVIGAGGYYNTYDQVPAEYKHEIPSAPDSRSFDFGIGVGTTYSLFNKIKMDIRYLYQVNSSLVNMHQVLLGFVF